MFIKGLIGLVFAGALAFNAMAADIVVRISPPRAVIERRAPRPSRNAVWVSGYQRWDGNAYGWTPGRWEEPARPHARWTAHKWVRRNGGWVLVEGRWR
jgi:hypothetical protein